MSEDERELTNLFVIAVCAVIAAAVVVSALVSHWFALRLEADFWPIDASRVAPNILASAVQAVVVVLVLAVVYKPLKRRIEASLQRHKNDLMSHAHDLHKELLARVNHIIRHHPDIPEYRRRK